MTIAIITLPRRSRFPEEEVEIGPTWGHAQQITPDPGTAFAHFYLFPVNTYKYDIYAIITQPCQQIC